jgi:hypothetical protein
VSRPPSVADRLRAELTAALRAQAPAQRLRIALALGRRDQARLRAGRPGLSAAEDARLAVPPADSARRWRRMRAWEDPP